MQCAYRSLKSGQKTIYFSKKSKMKHIFFQNLCHKKYAIIILQRIEDES